MSGSGRKRRPLSGAGGAVLLLAAFQAEAAPRALSESALDRVVAGASGASPAGAVSGSPHAGAAAGGRLPAGSAAGAPVSYGPGPAQPAVDGQAGQAGQAGPPGAPLPGRREAVVGHDAVLDLTLEAALRLEGDTQRALRGLFVANAAAADAVSALNVFDGARPGSQPDLAGHHLRTGQYNALTQTERVGARLGASVVTGPTTTSRSVERFRSGATSARSLSQTRQNLLHSSRAEAIDIDVQVPAFSPFRDFSIAPTLGTTESFTLPGFSFDLTDSFKVNDIVDVGPIGDVSLGTFGVKADVGSSVLGVPQITFGELRLEGDDLVLAPGELKLPDIDIGDVSGTVCFISCAGGTIQFDRIEATTLEFPIRQQRFAGANPFKDFDLQLGQGLAAAGTGRFDFQTLGGEITAALGFSLPDFEGPELDLTLVPNLGFIKDFSVGVGEINVDIPASKIVNALRNSTTITLDLPDIDLPDIGFEVTLFDAERDIPAQFLGFSGAFDGVICISMITTSCGTQERTLVESSDRIDNRRLLASASAASFEAWSESHERTARPGAELREAEAELIAMSGASADVQDYSLVILSGSAQQRLRAMNVANVTTAMVGSAANVARSPAGGRGAPASGLLNQTNVFVQGFQGR